VKKLIDQPNNIVGFSAVAWVIWISNHRHAYKFIYLVEIRTFDVSYLI